MQACRLCLDPRRLVPRPSVGSLMELCEKNFALLMRLAPNLRDARGVLRSRRRGVDLHLDVQEQSRYTTLLRLTYYFPDHGVSEPRPEPDARLRIYHDARQVEILDLRQTAMPILAHYGPPALAQKWRANIFLSKWLVFCLQQGHRFGAQADPLSLQAGDDVLYSCT